MSRLLLFTLFSVILSACGSKGALYLENNKPETNQQEPSNPPKAKPDSSKTDLNADNLKRPKKQQDGQQSVQQGEKR